MSKNQILNAKTALKYCNIAVEICIGTEESTLKTLSEALESGITAGAIREVIMTGYLFDGYPTALEGLRLLDELAPSPSMADGACFYSPENVEHWRQRGEALCQKIYGPQFNALIRRVETFAPELRDAMIVEGYGKVLSRPGFDVRYRELCVVSILIVKNRPRQLLSHALGSLRLGVSAELLQIIFDEISLRVNSNLQTSLQAVISRAIQTQDAS